MNADEILQRLAIELGHHLPFETARRVFGNVASDIEERRPIDKTLLEWSQSATSRLRKLLPTTAETTENQTP